MTNELVLKTLNRAIIKYKPSNLIVHTDLGSQYTSNEFESRLKELKIKHSFSHKGCPYDNAGIESFHATLKKEDVYPQKDKYKDFKSARIQLFKYIEGFYNSRRIHGALNFITPNEAERRALSGSI